MVGKWYKNNKNKDAMNRLFDEAQKSKNLEKFQEIVTKSNVYAHDEKLEKMERAYWFHFGYNVLNDFIVLSMYKDEINTRSVEERAVEWKEFEKEYEQCLYFHRSAISLVEEYAKIIDKNDKFETELLLDFYNSLLLNYSNTLSQTGRFVSSISILNSIKKENISKFSIVLGNLGLKINAYAKGNPDPNHQYLLNKKAYECLNQSLSDTNLASDERALFNKYRVEIFNKYGESLFEKHIPDTLLIYDMKNEEKMYRIWCSQNILFLNALNEINTDFECAYDPLHLPSMLFPIKECNHKYHGLFNQIKQEYVSARYLIYEGLEKKELHFSDKNVFLADTQDYPVYCLGVEKVKAAYKSIYSIFDRIAYFLNEYFELGIPEKDVSHKRIIQPKNKDKKSINNIMEKNHPLLGLWWLFKDISNKKFGDSGEYLDPIIANISNVRNAMEHRYLKIVGYFNINELNNQNDSLAYCLDFFVFEKLTISLTQYAREAIILLVMAINVEESHKKGACDLNKKIRHVPISKFEDTQKQIF